MNLPDPKQLKKLVKTCRALGIYSFKCADFEFTLDVNQPAKVDKKAPKQPLPSLPQDFDSDMPSEEELLFWSSGGPVEKETS